MREGMFKSHLIVDVLVASCYTTKGSVGRMRPDFFRDKMPPPVVAMVLTVVRVIISFYLRSLVNLHL